MSGISDGVRRGYHAHKQLQQVLVCVSGSCKVLLDDGNEKLEIKLDNPQKGLLITSLIWREMYQFSKNCVLLVLASEVYDESDYIRDYKEFKKLANESLENSSYFHHKNALVETKKIGRGTKVWAFSHILPDAEIGDYCNINDFTFIENDVVIGNNVTVKSGVYIWDGVTIEDNVFIGPNVTFTNDHMPRSKQYPDRFLKTKLEKYCSIGANVTIIAGNTIGKYSMIGAGSVVTKNIPSYTLYYGNPAIFHGYVCKQGHKLDREMHCIQCDKDYKEIINVLGVVE